MEINLTAQEVSCNYIMCIWRFDIYSVFFLGGEGVVSGLKTLFSYLEFST